MAKHVDYLVHIDERPYYATEFDKCPCDEHLLMKLESVERMKLQRDTSKENYFRTKLLEWGGGVTKKGN